VKRLSVYVSEEEIVIHNSMAQVSVSLTKNNPMVVQTGETEPEEEYIPPES